MIIEGAIAVKACIKASKRQIYNIYIDKQKKTKDFNYIRKQCLLNNIKLIETNQEVFKKFNVGKTFGGIIAEVGKRKSDDLKSGHIFYIDGIEDPFNMGYIFRTIYALGINNVILKERDYFLLDPQILKSSAGAYEFLNIKYVHDEYEYLKSLKEHYYFYSLYRGDNSKNIFDANFKFPALFMIGGEKRGISSKLLTLVDEGLYIPYGNDFKNSLNAASAVSVIATLLFKQKK